MSEILSIEKLREMANPIIEIPNFDNTGYIKIRVQRPKLLKMAAEGKIPNHLMNIAATLINGKPRSKQSELSAEEYIREINSAMELYCMACLVEPSYKEFKDILTDDQKATIFSWGLGEVQVLDSFRTDEGNGSSNNNGKTL
jgi:hypothetical protein